MSSSSSQASCTNHIVILVPLSPANSIDDVGEVRRNENSTCGAPFTHANHHWMSQLASEWMHEYQPSELHTPRTGIPMSCVAISLQLACTVQQIYIIPMHMDGHTTPDNIQSWDSCRHRLWVPSWEQKCQCRFGRLGVRARSDADPVLSHLSPKCTSPETAQPAQHSNRGWLPCHSQRLPTCLVHTVIEHKQEDIRIVFLQYTHKCTCCKYTILHTGPDGQTFETQIQVTQHVRRTQNHQKWTLIPLLWLRVISNNNCSIHSVYT